MSVFVDTGVFYAHHDTDASRHGVAVAALNGVLRDAAYGRVLTSDDVYDEVVTLTHRRTGSMSVGGYAATAIPTPSNCSTPPRHGSTTPSRFTSGTPTTT